MERDIQTVGDIKELENVFVCGQSKKIMRNTALKQASFVPEFDEKAWMT